MTETLELLRDIPDTLAGRVLRWWLTIVADEGEGASAAEFEARLSPSLLEQLSLKDADDAAVRNSLRGLASRLGAPVKVTVERASDFEITVAVSTAKERNWVIALVLESDPPHRALTLRVDRRHDFKLEVREAVEADALTLADIERRCPIVMGETSAWFDRGADYFAVTRLMEDCTIGLASVDGVPAAVSCGAERRVRVGGVIKKMVTVSHLRVLPEHQRKGLWGAANRVLEKYWPRVDGSNAYISVDNAGMQHGFANTPNKWPQIIERAELDCAALAGPMAGRAATEADAADIVRRLNDFHDAEELFVPYTEASLAERMSRAPDLYGWDKLWMTDGAVVGVWPAGIALRLITETRGERTVTVPGVVLDYAFLPGAEAEFEALLRAWCGALAAKGMDTLVINTSPASTGTELLNGLARTVGRYFMWSPGIEVPPGAENRGLYTDAVYL
jgi:hypothetical protein